MWIVCCYLPDYSIACEQAVQPAIQSAPIALSDDDGILRAVSVHASQRGVRPGQTISSGRIFCADLLVLPYRLPLYNEMAEDLWDRLSCDSSCVEPLSPEMCFASFSGADLHRRLEDMALDLRNISRTSVHIAMSQSRFTAHAVALRNTTTTPVVVPPGREPDLLRDIPLHEVPQFTREEYQRLHRLGVQTLGEVLACDEGDLYRILHKRSLLFRRLAQGLDRDPVQPQWPPDCVEHALHLDDGIPDTAMLHEALRQCTRQIAAILTARGRRCRSITLIATHERGRSQVQTEKLYVPESRERSLFRAAVRLWDRMSQERAKPHPHADDCTDRLPEGPPTDIRVRVRIAEATGSVSAPLLDDDPLSEAGSYERRRRLEAARSFVCERFGRHAVNNATGLQRPQSHRLWTYPLTRRLDEGIEIAIDGKGDPVRYRRDGAWLNITRIRDRWSEAMNPYTGGLSQGRPQEQFFFRVETASLAVLDLCRPYNDAQSPCRWRITGLSD